MNLPTTQELIAHIAEHYGVPLQTAQSLCRIPTHPVTLRDEFAKEAMNGMIASRNSYHTEDVAIASYRMADAMLKVRK